MDHAEIAATTRSLLPGLLASLGELVALPSVAFPGFPAEPVHAAARATADLLRASGAADVRLLDVPGGYPAVYADVPGPEGAPTVLLYAHYDVQPAPAEQGWSTDPWTLTEVDGRLHGRGAADDKSGVVIHAGTLQVFGGRPPVRVKILVEGEEETVSHLDAVVEAHPELVDCDAFVIADVGNQAVGRPALTTALRGEVSCVVRVSTLAQPLHSGLFGGAAPDALLALVRVLASLHDDEGSTVVAGLHHEPWAGGEPDAAVFRSAAGVLDGVDLVGVGSLARRLWASPSATVIGIDAPTVAEGSNVLHPTAAAKVSLRIAPGADAGAELEALAEHLRGHAPWGARVEVEKLRGGWPFSVDTTTPGFTAAREAMAAAFGTEVELIGVGGSIPLVHTLKQASPRADVVLWGAEDTERARIHAADESVDPGELERVVVAQAGMLVALGAAGPGAG